MKARTKLQKAVVKSAESLPPLSKHQQRQAIKVVAPHIAKLNSKGDYICLDCGHQWHGEKSEHVVCPECKSKLDVDTTRKRIFRYKDYFATITTCNGFQVIRMFMLHTNLVKEKKADHWMIEVFQRWISPKGENVIISRTRNMMCGYCDSWNYGSELDLRNEGYAHTVNPYAIIGRQIVIPELKKHGYDGNLHDCSPRNIFTALLSDNYVETLWKIGWANVAVHFIKSGNRLSNYWPSIKIAIRHKYHISDASIWCDMVNMLNELGKDVRNPKFICPENLNEAHDYWQHKVQAKREVERERRLREQELARERRYLEDQKRAEEDELKYHQAMEKFLDLLFEDNELSVKPLMSVKEFIEEGNLHHHCVFSNKYYEKENCLIFHAMVGGISIATIELNLQNLEIVQCRGKYNQKPELYDRIIALIQSNKEQIAKRQSA